MSATDMPENWRTLAADLFEHHESVVERLARLNPTIDHEELHDAFVKAVLDIAAEPAKFDASRETKIEDFLVGAAQRALLQILRGHRRRRNREEKKAAAVANAPPAARLPVDAMADGELAERARAVAETDEERKVLELWELGHTDAEIAEQTGMEADGVRRTRDRVTQRLRRLRDKFPNDEEP